MKRHSPAWWMMTTARVLLGAVFVYAAYTKFRTSYLLFAMAIDAYRVLPEEGAVWVARTLPWVELFLGLALIAGVWLRVTATSATLLLAVFFTAMVHAYQPDLKEGEQISCGCFGLGEPISGRTLTRDGALLALSLALAVTAFWVARRRRLAAAEQTAAPAAVATLAEKS